MSGSDLCQNSSGCLSFSFFFGSQEYDAQADAEFHSRIQVLGGWLAALLGHSTLNYRKTSEVFILCSYYEVVFFFTAAITVLFYYYFNIQEVLILSLVIDRGGLRNISSV